MIIEVKSAKDSKFWYANSIGRAYVVFTQGATEYVVRDNEGYLNIVLKEDSRVLDAD
jgi:hypothetical protein